jgi:hypothetical protein
VTDGTKQEQIEQTLAQFSIARIAYVANQTVGIGKLRTDDGNASV